jgi:hypothetical protein
LLSLVTEMLDAHGGVALTVCGQVLPEVVL